MSGQGLCASALPWTMLRMSGSGAKHEIGRLDEFEIGACSELRRRSEQRRERLYLPQVLRCRDPARMRK